MNAAVGFITAGLQYGLDSILIKPRRSIGAFKAQVTIKEQHTDELEITEHPVEQGAAISDHAYKRPAVLVIEAGWSNSPSVAGPFEGVAAGLRATVTGVQSLITGNAASQVREIYAKLLKLQSDRIPFDVYTGKRIYNNMLVKGLSTTTDKDTENSLIITATLWQVIIVSTQTVTIAAPAANQANPSSTMPPANSGTKQLVPSSRYDPPTNLLMP